jgi:uncharacterized protein YbcI
MMDKSNATMAQQIAQAAIAFEQRRTGNHVPKSVSVVLSEGTLVITLHEALSPAERELAKTPGGAAQMQEFHRQLFANSSESLRQEIKTITGMDVREATAEVEPASGAVVQAFTTGTVVQVFLLAGKRKFTRQSLMKSKVRPCWSNRGTARKSREERPASFSKQRGVDR